MLTTRQSCNNSVDASFHVQSSRRSLFANCWILCDRNVRMNDRLNFFDKVVSSVACFAAAQRTIYQHDLNMLDVSFRRLTRQIVGPPGGLDWSQPIHNILHIWHERLHYVLDKTSIKPWSRITLQRYWQMAAYIAGLPSDRWVRRVLAWRPHGRRSRGRPCYTWESKLVAFCELAQLGCWLDAARDARAWNSMMQDFVSFVLT